MLEKDIYEVAIDERIRHVTLHYVAETEATKS
jgi:hypothetical protein